MYKLQEIKEEIYTNVVNAFLSGSPIFSEDQVRKGINLFIGKHPTPILAV